MNLINWLKRRCAKWQLLSMAAISLGSSVTVMAGPKGAVGDLYVANSEANTIVQIDSTTGLVVGDFVTGLPSRPFDARFGPNGNLFVAEIDTGTVTEHDGNTGAMVDLFISGLNAPSGLRFEANGNLLVFESGTGNIREFDTSGKLIGLFIAGINGDDAPLDFGPDGNLYVSNGSVIQRHDPSGNFIDVFASDNSLSIAESHVFGPNGNLFVCSAARRTVVEFDGITGALIGNFIVTNLLFPTGLAFGPDGNVWVANFAGDEVNEFDGTTGNWIRRVTGLFSPLSITVKPDTGPSDCLTMTVSTMKGGQIATWGVSGATPGSMVAVVYGLRVGSTIINNQFGFCATFGIKGVSQSKVIGTAAADSAGQVLIVKTVPGSAGGLTVHTQAAEQGTCPDECMSNLDTQVVQ